MKRGKFSQINFLRNFKWGLYYVYILISPRMFSLCMMHQHFSHIDMCLHNVHNNDQLKFLQRTSETKHIFEDPNDNLFCTSVAVAFSLFHVTRCTSAWHKLQYQTQPTARYPTDSRHWHGNKAAHHRSFSCASQLGVSLNQFPF
jgi:hypothetical protein